ncbi:MAG TPA: DUF3347 domain-containing protein [Ginsengibacter sp.]|nr:DUF3347 domain-containing protein [Ginsengibacter sp.]HRP45516.1 DUF3347 domain-containing protein [Ginsengibacter sp.]
MKKQIILVGAFVVGLAACNQQSKNETTEQQTTEAHASMSANDEANIVMVSAKYAEPGPEVGGLVKSLVADYLDMKAALVKGDEATVAKSAEAIAGQLKSFDKSFLKSDEKADFDQIVPGISQSAQAIAKSKLDEQRKSFIEMSNNMHKLVSTFESGKELYQQYCPMYEGGSSWLSDSKDILNPYYGDKMLTCGTVKEAIH